MYNFQYLTLIEHKKHRDNVLASVNLNTHTNTDSQIMNQLVLIIVPLGGKRFHKIGFVAYRSHNADVWCNMHLHADAWRDKQAKTLLFF
jgi:hypothetical protein